MSWQDELHRIPTRNRELLERLVGQRITRMVHFAEPPAELLENRSYTARHVTACQLFSLADGPVVIETDQESVCIGDEAALASITIERTPVEELAADWPVAIDAADPEFSEPRFGRIVGRRIVGVRVLQMVVEPDRLDYVDKNGVRRIMSAKILDRPREVAVIFDVDDGEQLIVGIDIFDAPNDLAVLTGEDLLDASSAYAEVMRLP